MSMFIRLELQQCNFVYLRYTLFYYFVYFKYMKSY